MRRFHFLVPLTGATLLAVASCFLPGCGDTTAPDAWAPPLAVTFADSCPWELGAEFTVPEGCSAWRFEPADGSPPTDTVLRTHLRGRKFHWSWEFAEPPSIAAGGRLVPENLLLWHGVETGPVAADSTLPLPLLRIHVESECYPDLLSLMQDLSEPWFKYRVKHWPELPVPIRVGTAVGGLVDLSDCLRQAIAIWNGDSDHPWFRIDEEAAWGVRLVHFEDTHLSPPLAARITRLDDEHRPLRISILVGNNYDDLHEPKYVVRGFVHELAHALFLWGHSRDRNHCLWGAAPPIVDRPHDDERKAALLWHGLPEGTDLSKYYPVSEPAARTAPSRPAGHPATPPQPACRLR